MTDPGAAAGTDTVFVIVESWTHDGYDQNPVEQESLLEAEGWFATREAAQARADQLDRPLHLAHAEDEQKRADRRAAEIAEAEDHNRGVDVLLAAGFDRSHVKVPAPYVQRDFQTWLASRSSHSVHLVTEVERSRFDPA